MKELEKLQAIKKYLADTRKALNKEYGRSSPYGNGLKAGIDDAARAVSAIMAGKAYDQETDTWQ